MALGSLSPWFDPTHVQAVRDTFPEWMALVFAALSYFGSVYFVAPAVVLTYWFVDRRRFAPWIAVVAGGYAVMAGVKALLDVPRADVGPAVAPDALPLLLQIPYSTQVHVTDASFPSGHALAATVVWTMLALELNVGTRRQRLMGAGLMIGLVALSRVGNGLHYPTDVAGGVALGLVYVAAMLALLSWTNRKRTTLFEPRSIRETPSPTTAVFAVVAVLAVGALTVTGETTEAGLVGIALGGLVGWNFPDPRWPSLRRSVGYGFLSILGVTAFFLVSSVAYVVPFAVGLVTATFVVALPNLLETTSGPLSMRISRE